jgi:Cd2+/Zn2+-exporting ATPase
MEIADNAKTNSLITQAGAIVKRYAPEVVMNEKETSQPGQKTLYLLGLCCGDCPQKIKAQVGRIDGVKSVSLDFVTQKLTIEALDKKNLPFIIRQAVQIALDIEPAIRISYTGKKPVTESSDRLKKWAYRIILCIGAALFIAGMVFDFGWPGDLAYSYSAIC